MKKVHENTLGVLLVRRVIVALFVGRFLTGLYFLFKEYEFVFKLIVVFSFILFMVTLYEIINAFLMCKNTRYKITEKAVCIENGGFYISKKTFPVGRIQNLSIGQDVFSHFFNLYKLTIYTAGGSHELLYIPEDVALSLKVQLLSWLDKELEMHG